MASAFDFTPAPKARRLAMLSVLAAALICVLSQAGVMIGGRTLSFLMVPTLAVILWPKGANALLSLVGIFGLGLFQDYLSYGPTGLWALTWLAVFLIYRPDARDKPETLWGHWALAFFILLGAALLQFCLAKFVLARSIDASALLFSVFAAVSLFPPFYWIRDYLSRAFGDGENFYYEAPSQ